MSTISLSPRERQVLECRRQGLPYKIAASRMGITLSTFKHYMENSFLKLGARSSLEAINLMQQARKLR